MIKGQLTIQTLIDHLNQMVNLDRVPVTAPIHFVEATDGGVVTYQPLMTPDITLDDSAEGVRILIG